MTSSSGRTGRSNSAFVFFVFFCKKRQFVVITQDWYGIQHWNSSDNWTLIIRPHKLNDVMMTSSGFELQQIKVKYFKEIITPEPHGGFWQSTYHRTGRSNFKKRYTQNDPIWPWLPVQIKSWTILQFLISKTT